MSNPETKRPPPSPLPAAKASPIFLKVYRDLVTSGLLAQLSGSEVKVLLALGLQANVLGGTPSAERHFQRLQALDVVTLADRGRLFCYLDRTAIARRTGLSVRTVSTASNALAALDLVEKRSVRAPGGRHHYNIYFIQPASHLAKFSANQPSPGSVEHEPHHGQHPTPVAAVGKEPPAATCPHIKNKKSNGAVDQDSGYAALAPSQSTTAAAPSVPPASALPSPLDAQVYARFAARQGVQCYQPDPRDRDGLARVRAEGYTQDQILAAVDLAFDRRHPGAGPVRSFTYCLPVVRSQQPPARQPQPVPSGSPVVTPLAEGPRPEATPTAPAPATTSSPPAAKGAVSASSVAVAPRDGWPSSMQRVYDRVGEAGLPLDDALQRALRAKALRVDEAARQQGATGPDWVAEAMLLALGRKVAPNGGPSPSAEQLLAYADGILNNWTCHGHRSTGTTTLPPPAHSRPSPDSPTSPRSRLTSPPPPNSGPPEGHLFHRQPQAEKDLLWDQILCLLQGQMSRATFDNWLRGSQLLDLHRPDTGAARLVIQVARPHAVAWLENRLKSVVQSTVERQVGQPVQLAYRVCAATNPPPPAAAERDTPERQTRYLAP